MEHRTHNLRVLGLTLLLLISVFAFLGPSVAAEEWIKTDIGNVGGTIYSVDVGDGDNNAKDEVYVASRNGGVFKFQQKEGNPKDWNLETVGFGEGQNFNMRTVIVADGRADGKQAVYAGGQDVAGWPYDGKMYEFRHKNNNWETTHMWTGGWGIYDLDFGDGDNDGEESLYAASYDGRVYEYQYTNSWNANDIGLTEYYAMGVAVGDGDNDNNNEVFVVSGYYNPWYPKKAYRYSYSGGSWTITDLGGPPENTQGTLFRDIIVGDGDNDGKNEVYIADYGYVYEIEFSDVDTWSWDTIYSNQNQYIHHLALGDGDADGKNEIYAAAAQTNAVYQIEYNDGNWGNEAIGSGNDEMWGVAVGNGDIFPDQVEVYGGSADSHVYQFMMDRTPPPNPVVWSPTHTVDVWSNIKNVEVQWRHPPDPSGIRGYSFEWSTSATTVPDDTIDITGEEKPATESGPLDDGTYYFHIRAQDNARNWNPGATHFGPLKIDTGTPDNLGININNDATYTNNKLVTLYLNGNDTRSGMGFMAFSNDGSTWPDIDAWEFWNTTRENWDLTDINFGGNDNDGYKQVSMRAADKALNQGTHMVNDTIFLDRAKPVSLSIKINNGDQYTNDPVVYLNISANDPDPASGLDLIQFSNDGVTWGDWEPWTTYRSGWNLTGDAGGVAGDGQKTVYFQVKDKAGNVAGPMSDDIFLDRSAPTDLSILIDSGAAYTNQTNVALNQSAQDPSPGAGVYQMSFSNDMAQWSSWEEFSDYKNPWSLTVGAGGSDTDGDKPVYFRVKDSVGNVGGPIKDTIFLDRVKPNQLSVVINDGATLTGSLDVTLTLSANDPDPASGLSMMQFKEEGGTWGSWQAWSTSKAFTLTGGDGTKTVHMKVKDKAGNIAGPVSDSIVLDTTAPIISNVQAISVTDKSAIIIWTTDSPADSTVDHGTTTAYGQQKFDGTFVTAHSVTLTGLAPETLYHYRVASSDEVGNGPSVSSDHTFTTTKTPDTTPPVISNLRVDGVTDTIANILWDTNEGATSVVHYGETTDYGNVIKDDVHVQKHSVKIAVLLPSTTYFVKVESTDPSGNGPASATIEFTTLSTPDTTPPVITNVKHSGITNSKATISWTTDELADSIVDFGMTTSFGMSATDPSPQISHKIYLNGLTPGTTYYYVVRSTDQSGNGPTTSSQYQFTTLTIADTTPPVISNVKPNGVTNTMATITWNTNEDADSIVEFGTTTSYGQSAEGIDFVTGHKILLTGLSPGTAYHFRVKSTDLSGNGPSVSEDHTFTTTVVEDKEPPIIEWVKVEGVSNIVAVILWKTNEASDSMVEFGLDINYGKKIKDDSPVLEHSILLKDLNSSTLYHFRVSSTDLSGNGPTYSNDHQFTTENLTDTWRPEITNVSVIKVTENSAVITWLTNEPANSMVGYGLNMTTGAPIGDMDHHLLDHTVILQDLEPGTTYWYMVFSTDPSGNTGNSSMASFKTDKKVDPTPPGPNPNPLAEKNWFWPLLILIIIIIAVVAVLGMYIRSKNRSKAAPVRGRTRAAGGRTRARDEDDIMEAEELEMEEDMDTLDMDEGEDLGTLDMASDEEDADWDMDDGDGMDEELGTLDMDEGEDLGTLDMGSDEGDLELGGAIGAITGVSAMAPVVEKREPLKKVRCPGCKAAIPIYSETQSDIECPECGKQGKIKPMRSSSEEGKRTRGRQARPSSGPSRTKGPASPLDDILGPGTVAGTTRGAGPRTRRPSRPVTGPKPTQRGAPKAAATTGRSSGPKRTPLKTLNCSGCKGKVPVYTDKRPVRITCPTCGKSGTIKR